ncbi:MAG: hypothetical protein HUK21_13055 [Fibrobacteraceae bacterium]|nr:hypothetical protein [Fibrobacteraceae bacterium]
MEELFAFVLVFAPSSAMAGLDDMLLLSSLQATIEKAVAKANKNGNSFFIVFSLITIFNIIEKSPSGRKKLYVKKNLQTTIRSIIFVIKKTILWSLLLP